MYVDVDVDYDPCDLTEAYCATCWQPLATFDECGRGTCNTCAHWPRRTLKEACRYTLARLQQIENGSPEMATAFLSIRRALKTALPPEMDLSPFDED